MSDLKISEVIEGSIAHEAGIEPGDVLISMNQQVITDVFDYRFLSADEKVFLEILKPDGDILQVDIDKEEWEDIGLSFEKPLLDEERSCSNQCIFCFIDQLPKGMRSSLYYKDDDARLSFLYGNYITMTNMKNDELDRIIRYRMSPVNVSVHTTNPECRVFMLKNRFAGDILSKMKHLSDHGIILNAQIVLCKGVNDGKELERTISDLSTLMPNLNSISIVPVGLTKYRQNLPMLQAFDKESAIALIGKVKQWQEDFMKQTGSRRIYLSDEWFLMSGSVLPDYESYEDFPQIENGVGMMSAFCQEFKESLAREKKRHVHQVISIATGMLASGIISELAAQAEKRFPELKILVYPIENRLFGNTVTVTGLLTGADILDQVMGKPLGNKLLLPSNMFRSGTDIFLDDMSKSDLSRSLHVDVIKVENFGDAFLKALL